ncbi:MAG: hypothetical protein ABW174_12800 [Flavitalea sp.]
MKKYILGLAITLVAGVSALAQCDSTISLKTSRQERLNDKDEVVKAQDDVATIEITKEKIVITKDDGNNIMDATITKKSCDWKSFLKDGKATYEIRITPPEGEVKEAKAWIEATAGKKTFYILMNDRKIKAIID